LEGRDARQTARLHSLADVGSAYRCNQFGMETVVVPRYEEMKVGTPSPPLPQGWAFPDVPLLRSPWPDCLGDSEGGLPALAEAS
jgi:hypothetical protein